MPSSSEREQCSYLNPLDADAVSEFALLVRGAGGPRAAGRKMRVSAAHLCNIIARRRKLFPHLLARAKGSLRDRDQGPAGYVRLLSPQEWALEHGGEPYERTARRRGWLDDDDDDGW